MKYKLIFTVPLSHADAVRKAIGEAGAGRYEKYEFCSFSTRGIGRFIPKKGAAPFVGMSGKMEEVEEERVECQIDAELVDVILDALKKTHPYETIAYDLFPLDRRVA